MNIWEYIDLHPIYTFFLGIFILIVIGTIGDYLFKFWNRMWRHMNVRKAGWPPSHLDADGDWKADTAREGRTTGEPK